MSVWITHEKMVDIEISIQNRLGFNGKSLGCQALIPAIDIFTDQRDNNSIRRWCRPFPALAYAQKPISTDAKNPALPLIQYLCQAQIFFIKF